MAKILALDVSNNTSSVAISNDDEILSYLEDFEPNMQAQHILPLIDRAAKSAGLNYQDIDYIVTTNGPGSFTGIRIGLSVAKAMAIGCNAKVMAINNFVVFYFRALSQSQNYVKIIVALDAYRHEVYLQTFEQYGALHSAPALLNNEETIEYIINSAKLAEGNVILTGSGVELIYNKLKEKIKYNTIKNIQILPRFRHIKAWYICRYAAYTLSKGDLSHFKPLEPLYIRPPYTN